MKRVPLFLLVAVALVVGSTSLGAEELKFIRGDADGDGRYTANDLTLTVQWMSGVRPVAVIEALDVDRNGRITLADVIQIYVLTQSVVTPRMEGVKFLRGDLDGDSRITLVDLRLLDSYIRFGGAIPGTMDSADLNRDGMITKTDFDLLARTLPAAPRTP